MRINCCLIFPDFNKYKFCAVVRTLVEHIAFATGFHVGTVNQYPGSFYIGGYKSGFHIHLGGDHLLRR